MNRISRLWNRLINRRPRSTPAEPACRLVPSDRSRAATAIHEAAHVVAGSVLGRAVTHATIVPTTDTLGHVRFRDEEDARLLETDLLDAKARARVERDLVCRLAGPEAERRLTGRVNRSGAAYDHAFVADVAFALCGGDQDKAHALIRWLEATTSRLVTDVWPQIEHVAVILLDHETVSGTELRRLLRKVEGARQLDAVDRVRGRWAGWVSWKPDKAPGRVRRSLSCRAA